MDTEDEGVDTDLLVAMSHEMRTPLNAIIGMTELVLDSSLSYEQRSMLKRVVRASEHLLGLVEDLLEVSRIDAGRLALRFEPFDPATMVEDVADSLYRQALDKDVTLVVDVGAVRHHFVGDSHRFAQIAMNLARNAVQYTPAGHVVLRLLDEQGLLVLEVEDTGPGMIDAVRERAFERFFRGDDTLPGSGLGLPIVRALAESMDGTASIEPRPGGGTVARVALPLERGENLPRLDRRRPIRVGICEVLPAEARALDRLLTSAGARVVPLETPCDPAECDLRIVSEAVLRQNELSCELHDHDFILVGSTPAGLARLGSMLGAKATLTAPVRRADLFAALDASTTKTEMPSERVTLMPTRNARRVLVAEDDPDNRGIILRALQHDGYVVDVAPDGPRALERLKSREYDLVITDVEMPGLSGIELTRSLRALEKRLKRDRAPVVVLTAHALPFVREEAMEAGADQFMAKPFRSTALRERLAKIMDHRLVVMVVDDDRASREVTSRLLEAEGMRVIRVASGEEALRIFESRRVDLVLSDLEMPGIGGLALARSLRSKDSSVGLVAVTGHDADEVEERCLAHGFDRVLTKPFGREVLPMLIDDLRDESVTEPLPARVRAESGQMPAIVPEPETTGESRAVIQALVDVEDLLPEFLGRRFAEVEELREAHAAGDRATLRAIAHRVRGSGGAYGFMALTALATELGEAARDDSSTEDRVSPVLDRLARYLDALHIEGSDGVVRRAADIARSASER